MISLISENISSARTKGLSVTINTDFAIDRQSAGMVGNAHTYHYHNAYEIYYLLSGDRYYFIKDRTYHAKRGALVFISPGEIHCASNYSEEAYKRILISFKKDYLSGLWEALGGQNIFRCFENENHLVELSEEEIPRVEAMLHLMLSEYKNLASDSESILKTSLYQLLAVASRRESKKTENETGNSDSVQKTVSEVAAYINNTYFADMRLLNLAESFYISPCYLSRIFKRVTGSSIVDYVNGVRIKESRRFLTDTNKKISEIADLVGYKSMTHFGRAFKSVTGLSPVEYRKMTRQKSIDI